MPTPGTAPLAAVMTRARLVLVQRHRAGHQSFADALRKRFDVAIVSSGRQAVLTARETTAHLVILDAVSMKTTGERITRQIKSGLPSIPLIHLLEAAGESAADVVLVLPFTARKLINAIDRVVRMPGADGAAKAPETMLQRGPFILNVTRRVLLAHGQETPLTPKLALLIEQFFRRPGETLDRGMLMEQVWQTSYLGDTRTLDVHVRWFRRAIETDPAHPVYLKTVRGIGYRFDPPQ